MRRVYTPPHVERTTVLQIAVALALTAGIFLILPLTQLLGSLRKTLEIVRIQEVTIPPPPPPKEPPPEEKKPEEKPELKEQIKPLTLSQLELVLNPGTGGALEGDFALGFGMVPDTIQEMKIFELHEVDREPVLIYAPEPQYPPKLYRERVRGSVTVFLIVNQSGTVTEARTQQTSGFREFDESALNAVRKYKFTPAIKDGQPVPVQFTQQITFSATR
jgi:protein TonB